MTTLVMIPYFGCPDLIDRCVHSILAQTVEDIALLVIGDGEVPPITVRDSRLEVYVTRDNHGPYYAQQIALLANPFDWYAPVGADDWIEPDHLERLSAMGGDAVMTGAVWFHNLSGGTSVHEGNYEVGLFATERLRRVGGHNPQERIGQDSLMLRLLRMTGDLRASSHPTYHRIKRADSLMTSPLTGKGTPMRNDMRRRNREVVAECERLRTADAIKRYREGLVPSWLADQVADHAFRVSQLLGTEVAA